MNRNIFFAVTCFFSKPGFFLFSERISQLPFKLQSQLGFLAHWQVLLTLVSLRYFYYETCVKQSLNVALRMYKYRVITVLCTKMVITCVKTTVMTSSYILRHYLANFHSLQDVDEMVSIERPDWQMVMCYVTSIYQHFEED